MKIQKSQRYHTAPPRIEDLGDGASYYNFNVVESASEEGDLIFDYDQVRMKNPVTEQDIEDLEVEGA